MKTLDNISYIHQRTPDPELAAKARGLAHEISDTHWPSFERMPDGVTLLYQTRRRYLEVFLADNGSVQFSGADTKGVCDLHGKSPLHFDFSFLGRWLSSDEELDNEEGL